MSLIDLFLERNRIKKLNVHCLGDAIIDQYYDVSVDRISAEYPGPIMSSNEDKCLSKPGGAANVAYQLKYLNLDVSLVCWCDQLTKQVLNDHEIKSINFSLKDGCAIPVKKRYLDSGIQVIRHDIESSFCKLDFDEIDSISKAVSDALNGIKKPDIAILSDYDKGFFSSSKFNILNCYNGVKTIVDPKRGDLSKWKGCTIFKPNAKEAFEFSGKKDPEDQCRFLQSKLECEAVIVTDGKNGVYGIYKNEFFKYCPRRKVLVESVIGAGDCFAAFFASAIAHEFNPIESSEIAWNAGSVYVQNRHNRPIIPAEISETRIVSPADLSNRDFKLVFTNGCFDLLHSGHIHTLEFAKSKGDKLVVALNSDGSIKRLKGNNRPIKTLDQRMLVMSYLRMVDFVVFFEEDTPYEIIKTIKPDVLVKGSDYQVGQIVGEDIVKEVYRAPLLEGLSTTNFVSKMST